MTNYTPSYSELSATFTPLTEEEIAFNLSSVDPYKGYLTKESNYVK